MSKKDSFLLSSKHCGQNPSKQRIGNLFLRRHINQRPQQGNLPDREILFLQVDEVVLEFHLFQVFGH
jgi:hypothetical protein